MIHRSAVATDEGNNVDHLIAVRNLTFMWMLFDPKTHPDIDADKVNLLMTTTLPELPEFPEFPQWDSEPSHTTKLTLE